ncbi:chromosome segregation protein SMC [Marivita sp. GX14005]|uniref:AAA family ATPase n=1 Tax=Marivita sp. GX14005 TaxID=2942276 RepID=UPI002018DDDE|nr:chromosome segregation protein SMC [Marivita sp. GX14005]MCL3882991.1 chromosome segregation protein SMC [Marivita sp. GX14005]
MRLRSITLKDVRRFIEPVRIDGITDGVNVLCAPNEFGKSTVFDALRALFFVPHGSTKKDIKHLRPHAGGAPEVSVEVQTPDGLFVISKRWFGKSAAKVMRGDVLIAQADEAEAWISRLLGGGDGGPSGLLWVRQGLLGLSDGEKSEQTTALEARRDLLSSVTGEVETMTGGRRMDAALARCHEELFAYATATGRPKAGGPWSDAIQEVETLSADRDKLASQVELLQSALDERRRHRDELADLEAPDAVAERKSRLDAAEAAFAAAEAYTGKVKAAEQALQTATLVADRARQELKVLRDARIEKSASETAERLASEHLVKAQDELARHEKALAEATKAHDEAEEERKHADTLVRRIQAQTSATAARERRAELEERIEKARSCREKVEAAKATASVGPDDRQMEKLRGLSAALTTARALRDSTATRVTMRYAPNRAGHVQQAGKALADGRELAIHTDTVLHLEGLGELTVHPGERPADIGDVSQAEADLAEALTWLGVSSVEDAARAHQKRQEAKSKLLQLEAEFRGHAPRGIEDLQKQIAALPDAPAQDIEELPPLDEAEVKLQSASRMVLELRARMNAARDQRDKARTAHTTALVRKEEAERRLNSAIEALGRLAQQDEDALAAVAAQANEKRLEAENDLAEAQSGAPDIAAAKAALTRAQSIEDAARIRIEELRPTIAALDERIRGSAGEAVEERLQETEEKLEAAEMRLACIAREVKVLERLQATLEAARSAARDRYFEPVAGELRPLLHLLWPDAELNWADDTLLPQSLIRNGQEETVDILSAGTQEQIALLVRLAFARLLSKDGRHAPVILDDALVFTDDDRIERMFDALHRQASDLQIIVLSCRQRAFRDLGGKALQISTTD